MATALIPLDKIKKELTCSICLNLLREPKDLDCPHTYCFECIVQYVHGKSTIECPECRHVTMKPGQGLSALKTNLRLKSMVENLFSGTGSGCSKNRQKKQELDDVERKLKSAKDKVEEEIKLQVQLVTAELKTWEMKMNQDVQKTYAKRMTILQEKSMELDKSSRLIGSSRSTVTRISALSIQEDDALLQDLTVLHLEPGQIHSSIFGKIVPSDNSEYETKTEQATLASHKPIVSADKELRLTFLTKFGDFHTRADSAMYVAANQSNYIVVGHRFSDISIYRNENGEYKQQTCQFRLERHPQCFAMSPQDKFIVNDGGIVKIFSSTIYSTSYAGNLNSSFMQIANKIAVTPKEIVVVTNRLSQHVYKENDVITLYHCDGVMIRRYQEKYDAIRYIASNDKQIAFTTEDTVQVIDFVTGDTLWTVSMSNPRGVCYEQNLDALLVSRCLTPQGQGVIEQYCSTTGRLISCLAKGLINPWGMTVTEDNKLVVADEETVKIYNIN